MKLYKFEILLERYNNIREGVQTQAQDTTGRILIAEINTAILNGRLSEKDLV